MSLDIPSYDASELEQIGRSFLEHHSTTPSTLPVDIELLIEIAGYDIRPIHNLRKQHGVLGVPVYYHNITAICIDQEHLDTQPEVVRFTEAEELSHILLHRTVFEDCRSLEDATKRYMSIDRQSHWVMDRNARYLAGILLMPFDTLLHDLTRTNQTIDLARVASYPDLLEQLYRDLAARYRVTPRAMHYRIGNAAFFNQRQELEEKFLKSRHR